MTTTRERMESASGQAGILFVAAGALGLIAAAVPGGDRTPPAMLMNVAALVLGVLVWVLPWKRWGRPATLTLVPPALALIAAGQIVSGERNTPLYGLWFAVVFVWIGSWHPPRTSLWVSPLALLAYAAPFLTSAGSAELLRAGSVAVPIAVILGEITAARAESTRLARLSLEEAGALLQRANLTDDLTGVGNRRLANVLLDTLRPGDGILLLDIDHFKRVNDTLGHAEGDRILASLGSYLMGAAREADTVARFGGEEFLVVVRGAGADLPGIAARLLEGWRARDLGVTVSAGAAVHHRGRSHHETFASADRLLYEAKGSGRDCAVSETIDGVPALALDPAGEHAWQVTADALLRRCVPLVSS